MSIFLYLWPWNLVFNIHWNLTLTADVRAPPVSIKLLICWPIGSFSVQIKQISAMLDFMLQKGLLCLSSWCCGILLSTSEEYRIYYHDPLLLRLEMGWSDSQLLVFPGLFLWILFFFLTLKQSQTHVKVGSTVQITFFPLRIISWPDAISLRNTWLYISCKQRHCPTYLKYSHQNQWHIIAIRAQISFKFHQMSYYYPLRQKDLVQNRTYLVIIFSLFQSETVIQSFIFDMKKISFDFCYLVTFEDYRPLIL